MQHSPSTIIRFWNSANESGISYRLILITWILLIKSFAHQIEIIQIAKGKGFIHQFLAIENVEAIQSWKSNYQNQNREE